MNESEARSTYGEIVAPQASGGGLSHAQSGNARRALFEDDGNYAACERVLEQARKEDSLQEAARSDLRTLGGDTDVVMQKL